MSLLDCLIVIIPLCFVLYAGWYSRRYIRGVVDYLSAGRLCGRYLLTVGDIANGISIIGVLSYIERRYKVGFGVVFWSNLLIPLTITLALTGYCIYRFRETKAQSGGQLIELRYGSRPLRFYVSFVRVLAEMLAHSIMPAVAARFFIYFFGMPESFTLFGLTFSTFVVTMVVCMAIAITLICFGGVLTIVLTDTLQGLICIPVMLILGIFLLLHFDFGQQVLPTLWDRVPGESFLNCFDVENARDFNLFTVVVSLLMTFIHRATWLGGTATGAAKSPHEQKMASLLGQWRGSLGGLLYTLLLVTVVVTLNHEDFAKSAREIRTDIAERVTNDIVKDAPTRARMLAAFALIPEQHHKIGRDTPLSDKKNLDTVYYNTARDILGKDPATRGKVQEFRSLYNQQMMSVTMRHVLGSGLLGLFALLMVLAMVSTDDSYIFTSAQTITQDMILPFFKKPPSPRLHIWILRLASIGVGAFFLVCSIGFAQIDYIELFRMAVLPMYLGGCGPVMTFALYGRFGTKQGAWTSILTGTGIALVFLFLQRNWGDLVYPWLDAHGWVPAVGNMFDVLCSPFKPYVVWTMNPYKFPINGYESYFINVVTTLILYVVVSYATLKEPFNLDRLLHRGIYNVDETKKTATNWSLRHVLTFLAGITPLHTFGDRILAWVLLGYSYVYRFFGTFILVLVWNLFQPWGLTGWGRYFMITFIYVPLTMAAITTVWFWIGGIWDLKNLFHDLKTRLADDLDNGMVANGVSLSDIEKFKKAEKQS